jgi:hypothetical protein
MEEDDDLCHHPYCLIVTQQSVIIRNGEIINGIVSASTAQKYTTRAPPTHRPTEYTYTPLKDVQVGQTLNIYGVIIDYTNIRPTKGTDLMRTLTIVDESKKPITLMLMRRNGMCEVSHVGQIYRAHRVKFESFQNQMQGQCGHGYDDLVLSNVVGEMIDPVVIQNKTFMASDRERVEQLRNWSHEFLKTQECNTSRQYSKSISTIWNMLSYSAAVYGDITCKIVNINTSTQTVILQVWDGSMPNQINANITITPAHVIELVTRQNSNVKPGTWIKLRNAYIKQWGNIDPGDDDMDAPPINILNVMTNDKSSIVVLPEYHHDVQQILSDAVVTNDTEEEPVLKVVTQNVVVTQTSFPKAPTSTIRFVQNDAKKPCKYRIKASVVEHFPRDIREFTRPICPECSRGLTRQLECKLCSQVVPKDDVKYQYMFQLMLKDETGMLPTFVFNEEAETLLCDLPACNLFDSENETTLNALKKRLEVLTNELSSVDLCLYAYVAKGQRVFQLTSTWLTHFDVK